jgi:hypothetical protein
MIAHSCLPAIDIQLHTTSQLLADRLNPMQQTLRAAQAHQRALDALRAQAKTQAHVAAFIMQQNRASHEFVINLLSWSFTDIGMIAQGEQSEAERLQAAGRIVKRLGRVIHPLRWPSVRDEAEQQADLHYGGDVSAEVRQRTIAALFEILPQQYDDIRLGPYYTTYTKLRRKLQAAVTRDFLGPQWTRRQRPREMLVPPESLQRISLHVQDLPELDEIFHSVAFSPREVEIFERLLAEESIDDIAAHLGVTKATIYVHCHNMRKKVLASGSLAGPSSPPLKNFFLPLKVSPSSREYGENPHAEEVSWNEFCRALSGKNHCRIANDCGQR